MDSMISITIIWSLCAFLLFIIYYYQFCKPNSGNESKRPLPRASGALPIIGHMHMFSSKQLVYKTLGAMAEKHGPAFTIKLGSQENLVVSSYEMAKECFTTLDKVFSDRPKITATRLLGYNGAMLGLSSYGPYWREMRKMVTLELLSHRRIDMLNHIRSSELQTSIHDLYLKATAAGGQGRGLLVDMKQWFGDLTLNTSVRMVGGKRTSNEGTRGQYKKAMRDFLYYFGVFVLSDAIPSLGWLDLQGHEKAMRRIAKKLDDIVGEWLDQHKERKRKMVSVQDQDFMDVMLTNLETAHFPDFTADVINKSTCLNVVLGGSDTTMITLTWALSLLLNNPHALKKAQEEVDTYVGKDRHVKESDIKDLVYLQAVVKETLRLYPPNPIIGLRSAMEDCTISPGYHVPSGMRLIVNVSKIQRDENLWPEPHEFRPERFFTTHKDVDVRGRHYELLPFGSGRRACPGISLALQMVHLILATLLHCYQFDKPSDAEIDMTESPGLTNLKATPLQVYITPRLHPEIFDM